MAEPRRRGLPLEVSLALRGERWRLPFHPEPPPLAHHPVPTEHVDAEAASRLLRMIERVTALVDTATTEPIPLIKSGAVGLRTLRTFAKTWDVEVDEVRLAVDLALATAVLAPAPLPEPPKGRGRKRPPPQPSPGLTPGPAASAWRSADAATRGRVLLDSWWRWDRSVLMDAAVAAELARAPCTGTCVTNWSTCMPPWGPGGQCPASRNWPVCWVGGHR